MDNTHENENQSPEVSLPEESAYVPRPVWQVWAARVGLVLFLVYMIYRYVNMFRGGF